MAMAFHEAWQQDLVGKARIDDMFAPLRPFFAGAGTQDAAVAHRHAIGLGPIGIQGDDLAGGIQRGGHGASSSKKVVAATCAAAYCRPRSCRAWAFPETD